MPFAALTHPGTDQLGNDICALAALSRIPAPDYILNCGNLAQESETIEDHASAIVNGCFGQWPEHWPPSDRLRPLLISLHISREQRANIRPSDFFLSPGMAKYLISHGPIGARDLDTLELLHQAGAEAYFSGCITLTLERPDIAYNPDLVVLNDLPANLLPHVRGRSFRHVLQTSHTGFPLQDPTERLHRAAELLALYASASCVVTTSLECALPCLAIGTPVLLITDSLPPYGTTGLKELLHHCSAEDYITTAYSYDTNNPPANKQDHLPLRAAQLQRIEAFVAGDADYIWQPNPQHPTAAERNATLAALGITLAA